MDTDEDYRQTVRSHKKWRDSIRMTARANVTRVLREKYPRTFARLRQRERSKEPDRSISYRRAEQALRKEFRKEYQFLMEVETFRIQQEQGYEPMPTGGHHTGRNAKPIGHPKRIDSDAAFMETS